jgi:hypothetical protein
MTNQKYQELILAQRILNNIGYNETTEKWVVTDLFGSYEYDSISEAIQDWIGELA